MVIKDYLYILSHFLAQKTSLYVISLLLLIVIKTYLKLFLKYSQLLVNAKPIIKLDFVLFFIKNTYSKNKGRIIW